MCAAAPVRGTRHHQHTRGFSFLAGFAANILFIDIPPLDLVAKQMWEFLLWEEIQDPSRVISITLETLVCSEICTNKAYFVHIEY